MEHITDKYNFQDKFDKVVKCTQNSLTDNYLDDLISLLEFRPVKRHVEMYKYTLFFLITIREKMTEIFTNTKNFDERKIEKIKSHIYNFMEDENVYLTSNEMLKMVYPDVFQNKEIVEKAKINRNNYIIQNIHNGQNVKKEKVVLQEVKNSVGIEKVLRKEDLVMKNYELGKKENFHPNGVGELNQIQNQNFNGLNALKSQPSSSSSGSVSVSDYNLLSTKDQKTVDDMKNKIDQILVKINSFENLNDYFLALFTGNTLEIFSQPGLFNDITNKMKYISLDHKLKFLTIYSKTFYAFSARQKDKIIDKMKADILPDLFDSKTNEKIIDNIFYSPKFITLIENRNVISKDFLFTLISDFYQKKDVVKSKDDIILMMKSLSCKNDILDLFYIFIINKKILILENVLNSKILFFLYIILTKDSYFSSENSYDFLYSLYMIKLFHEDKSIIGQNYFQKSENNEAIYKNYNFSKLEVHNKIGFADLFTKSEVKFCKNVVEAIKFFYKIDKKISPNSLFNTKNNNFEFTMNIVELLRMKQKFMYSDVDLYRSNLINLENLLYSNYKKFNMSYDFSQKFFDLKLYADQYQAYVEVSSLIQNVVDKKCKNKINVTILPFGSITQFLGNQDSDLDVYMQIEGGDKNERINFLRCLDYSIKHNYGSNNMVVTKRLVTMTYYNKNNVKVDLNYFGVCSVLNSTLLRVYAQCDMRFVILAHNIKLAIKSIDINNTDDKKTYLNSFSWMLLLITFLQDVISPPVLPKILHKSQPFPLKIESSDLSQKKKEFTDKKEQKKYFHMKHNNPRKELEDVILNTLYKEYDVNFTFFKEYKIIYENFLNNFEKKNEMSLSELFIKFFEFVIFYFKYDTVYLHTSFAGECFMNKSEIKNLESTDKNFLYSAKILESKGDILTREPFDYTYTPSQMKEGHTKEFIARLKNFYFGLLEYGRF